MADLYADYEALATAETEGVDYSRTSITPAGWVHNLALNPSLEVDLADTQGYGSSSTRTRVTTEAKIGVASVQHSFTADTAAGTTWSIHPARAGTTVQVGIWVKVPATGLTSGQMDWRQDGTSIRRDTFSPPAAGEWVRLTGSYTVGTGQVCNRVGVAFTGVSGTVWWADAAMVQTGDVLDDYVDTASIGATWAAIAIHGGGIEPGSGEIAREVAAAGERMAYYEFAGLKSSGNVDLHITSTNFDEPQALAMVGGVDRCLSFHGYTGTEGVAETAVGGLDTDLVDRITTALTTAGFTVVTAPSEIAGTDPANICNQTATSAGVQLELSRAQRDRFFPDGENTRAVRDSGARSAEFYAYASALRSAYFGRGLVAVSAINSSRYCLLPAPGDDVDLSATVATDVLATGGGHFLALTARHADTSNMYLARLEFSTAQAVVLTLRKRVGGVETFLVQHTTGLVHAAGSRFVIRLQVTGSTLRARAWADGAIEPTAWQLETTDTDLTAAGSVGMRTLLSSANTNPLPVTAAWGAFTTLGPRQTFRVIRSVNGIVKAQSAGTDVRLAHPTIVAL